MEEFVLGFLFNSNLSDVVLLKKNRPDWQKDKWNGLGGKLPEALPAEMVMRHKFEIESGKIVDEWIKFAVLQSENYLVHCFCAKDHTLSGGTVANDEMVDVFQTDGLPRNVIPNVRFLIPLAIDKLKNKNSFDFAVIKYGEKEIKS